MRNLLLGALCAALFIPSAASAAPILRLPESGQYRFHARVAADELPYDPADLSGTQTICAYNGIVEVGCFPVDSAGEVNVLITMANDGVDKNVYGRARDASGNESTDSVDFYLIDLTAPGGPVLIDASVDLPPGTDA